MGNGPTRYLVWECPGRCRAGPGQKHAIIPCIQAEICAVDRVAFFFEVPDRAGTARHWLREVSLARSMPRTPAVGLADFSLFFANRPLRPCRPCRHRDWYPRPSQSIADGLGHAVIDVEFIVHIKKVYIGTLARNFACSSLEKERSLTLRAVATSCGRSRDYSRWSLGKADERRSIHGESTASPYCGDKIGLDAESIEKRVGQHSVTLP